MRGCRDRGRERVFGGVFVFLVSGGDIEVGIVFVGGIENVDMEISGFGVFIV